MCILLLLFLLFSQGKVVALNVVIFPKSTGQIGPKFWILMGSNNFASYRGCVASLFFGYRSYLNVEDFFVWQIVFGLEIFWINIFQTCRAFKWIRDKLEFRFYLFSLVFTINCVAFAICCQCYCCYCFKRSSTEPNMHSTTKATPNTNVPIDSV